MSVHAGNTNIFKHNMDNKKSKRMVYVALTKEEILNNVPSKIKDERLLRSIFDYVDSEKKIELKAKRIWQNIMNFKPFYDNNEIHALECMYAFLKKNKFDLVTQDMKIVGDQYIDYIKLNYKNTNTIDFLFKMIKIKEEVNTDKIWGFKEKFPNITDTIKVYMETGKYSYERESEN